MAHVVIVGAGVGGMPAAYEIRDALGKSHKITVVSNHEYFQFVPSNPWVAVGWRARKDICFPVAPFLKKRGIEFIPSGVQKISPDENQIVLANGTILNYDFLVIATGPKLAFEEIPGLGPHGGYTDSICTVEHSEKAWDKWQVLVEEPGPIVVGAAPGASCFGPAYEAAFIMDSDLRKRKIRDKVPMTFVTSEPYIGHLGLGGVGDSKGMMESALRQHHIKWITNAKITKVEPDLLFASELNDQAAVIKEHELPFKYSIILPAFKGIDALMEVGEALVNPRGFVKVDEHQCNPKWKNIYSVGVCIAIAPIEATPVPTGMPKTGYMIESMVTATAHNIKNVLKGREPDAKATWNAICLADMGTTGIAFVAQPQIPPRNVAWMKKGRWVHAAKIAFEKYFISKMKKGNSEPLYEKYILASMGITKLKK
jgi:sulfide:quinone oxidoreductase